MINKELIENLRGVGRRQTCSNLIMNPLNQESVLKATLFRATNNAMSLYFNVGSYILM